MSITQPATAHASNPEGESGTNALVEILARRIAEILLPNLQPQSNPQTPPTRILETKLYRLTEVAELLSVCKRTVERRRDIGDLPCLLVGGQWRVKGASLSAYIRRQEISGHPARHRRKKK